MDYIKWSQEYIDEAQKLLIAIEHKKQKLHSATLDERHTLNADIIKLRNIYYECMLTAKHLCERAGVTQNAA
ncbi:MAG: hypothetical protein E7513_00055 [Ruminococcaceae bacterium]|nr:hypothetical protein [Oscillospiraceae bacterium]